MPHLKIKILNESLFTLRFNKDLSKECRKWHSTHNLFNDFDNSFNEI